MGREFLDTNVLIYAFATDPKSAIAEAIMARGCYISVQCLNEFANVARRKLRMDWNELRKALAAIRILCPKVTPLDIDDQIEALHLAERYGFAFFNGLIVASALHLQCRTLWSEDMQHGMVIEDRLTILNPFHSPILA